MLVSHKHKLVIFTLERTASTSIHSALRKYFDVEIDTIVSNFTLKHLMAEIFDKLINPFLPDEYYKIGVVREPVSRLVSLYSIAHKDLTFSDWWKACKNIPWSRQIDQLSVDGKLYLDRLFDFNRLDLFCEFLSSILKEDIKLPIFNKGRDEANISNQLVPLKHNGEIILPKDILKDMTIQLQDDILLYKSIVDAGGELVLNVRPEEDFEYVGIKC